MKAFLSIITAALTLSLSTASVFAQAGLAHRVTLSYEKAEPASVFSAFAASLGGLELDFDKTIAGPVTINVQEVTTKTAMTAVCESIGCTWHVRGNRLVVTPAAAGVVSIAFPNRVTSRVRVSTLLEGGKKVLPAGTVFNDVPLSKVLADLGSHMGIVPNAATRTPDPAVTIDVSGKTVSDGIRAVCESVGYPTLMFSAIARSPKGTRAAASSGPDGDLTNVSIVIDCRPRKQVKVKVK